jgi:hypothetical protein
MKAAGGNMDVSLKNLAGTHSYLQQASSRAPLATCFMLVSSLAYFSTCIVEMSFESLFDFDKTRWHYIPKRMPFIVTTARISDPSQILLHNLLQVALQEKINL